MRGRWALGAGRRIVSGAASAPRPAASIVVLLGATATALCAQELSGRLTLEDALSIARDRNPEYRQALNQTNAAAAQVRSGFGRFLPRLSASMGWNLQSSRTLTGTDDFGSPVALDDPIDFRSSSASQGISGSVTVFDGLANVNAYRAAGASADAAEASAAFTLRRVEAETTRRFYAALRTQRLIVVEERLLASAHEQLANTERRFRVAGAQREDVLGVRTDVANQELQLARAVGEAQKARLLLKEQLGITEDVDFTVDGELPTVFDLSELSVDSLLALAEAANPNLLSLEASAEAAHLQASAARGQRWPSVSLSASYSRGMSLPSYDALFELNPQNRGLGFGISFALPLFQGFQTSAQIAQSTATARNADEALRAGALATERAVRSALIDLENAHGALALAEQAAELSRERLQLARERYALAALQFTNLQQIINQASQAERQLVSARFEHATAVVNLEEAVGVEIRP
jgi:outer membrane protein TolC